MRHTLLAATLFALLASAACTRDGAQAPDATPPGDDSVPAAIAEQPEAPVETAAPTGSIQAEPATLRTCDPPAVVTVTWDARAAGASVVDIVAVNRAGKESLFFTGGTRGTRDTGAWMRSGSQLVLRDKDDGTELDRLVIEGTPCDDVSPADPAAPEDTPPA